MPELTFQDVVKKPNFYKLPKGEQKKVLNRVSENFKGLPTTEQDKVIDRLNVRGPITKPEELRPAQLAEEERLKIVKERRRGLATEKAIERGPEELGGTAGGLIGGRFGLPSIGAGLGGATGQLITQGIQKVTDSEKAPESVGEALKRIGISATKQAALEKGGRLAIGGIQKLISPFGKAVSQEGRIAIDTLDKFSPSARGFLSRNFGLKKVSVLPAEATESRFLDILQNVTEGSLFGGGTIQTLKEIERPAMFRRLFDDVLQRYGIQGNPEQLARLFDETVKNNLKLSRVPATAMYNTVSNRVKPIMETFPVKNMVPTNFVDEAGKPLMKEVVTQGERQIGGASVPLKGLKDIVEKEADILRELFPKGRAIESVASGDEIVKAVQNLKDNVPYEAAKELKTRLMAMAEAAEGVGRKTRAFGLSSKLVRKLDESIATELQRVDPESLKIWRRANKLWKASGLRFKNDFLKSLSNLREFKPEIIARDAFRNKSSSVAFKKSLRDPKLFDMFSNAWLDDVYTRSFQGGTRNINGNMLFDNTFGKKGLGEDTLRFVFGDAKTNTLKKSITTLQQIEAKQASGTGGMVIQLTQPGALFALAVGKADALASVILGGPAVVGRLMTNPLFHKWMLNASKLPPGSKALGSLLARVGAEANKIRNELKETRDRPLTMEEVQRLRGKTTLK